MLGTYFLKYILYCMNLSCCLINIYCFVNILSFFYHTQVLGFCCSGVWIIFFLRCGATWLGDWCPVGWDSIVVSSSRVKMPMDITTFADHCMVLKHQAPLTHWQCHIPEEQRHEILWCFCWNLSWRCLGNVWKL